MDSPETLIAFGAVMLVIALLGVAIDWFGKPMRHRKFVPKIYRFPDERQPKRSQVRETQWSDTAFVLPVVEARSPELLVRYPDARSAPSSLTPESAPPAAGPPTTQVPPVAMGQHAPLMDDPPSAGLGLVTLEDQLGPEATGLLDTDGSLIGHVPAAKPADPDQVAAPQSFDTEPDPPPDIDSDADDRTRGWRPGDYVFNFTAGGDEPSVATVRNRYWKNVAATAGAGMFGSANADRMATGKAPERRNPRTGRFEVMKLPQVHFADTSGETPVPEWPSSGLDPFATGPTG